eukprot:COSAG02_NODE_7387_length_3038_cov_1.543042_1_plen_585_part_00
MAHCVLVAGEHWKVTTGEHNMGTNHCSMEHVGAAFDSLRAAGVPRDRIIVIAQVEERREWLRRAIASGKPRCTSAAADGQEADDETAADASRRIYRRKLAALEELCGGIIREGGADYDGDAVNPETVFNVLTGALKDEPHSQSGPIVPRDCQGIALMVYSHGCSHETAPLDGEYYRNLLTTTPCDACGKPHPPAAEASATTQLDHEHVSLCTNEWYVHLPHNAPSAAQATVAANESAETSAETGAATVVQPEIVAAYEGIAHSEHPHPYSLLYWQILFRIYHRRFSVAPSVPMLVLLNSCRSGGLSKFLEQELVDRIYGVHSWPLYVMSSSQAERDAVVGGLWTSWFNNLDILQPVTDAHVTTGADALPALETVPTVSGYFAQVAAEYNKGHTYDLTNRLLASWQVPTLQAGADSGEFVTALHSECLSGGCIDYTALERFMRKHDIQPHLHCVQCKHFSRGGSRDGPCEGLLCSSCERDWVRAGHTNPLEQPEATHEGGAAVDQLLVAAKQAEQAIARPWAWSGARSDFGMSSLRDFLLGLRCQSQLQGQDKRKLGLMLTPDAEIDNMDMRTKRRCRAIDPASA